MRLSAFSIDLCTIRGQDVNLEPSVPFVQESDGGPYVNPMGTGKMVPTLPQVGYTVSAPVHRYGKIP